MTGGEKALRAAAQAGAEVCFANPGTTEMGFVEALERVPEVRSVLGLFEGVCTGMADGYARMRGKPALTLLHLGVGLGNGIANLHNARRAGSGIVNVVGDHPTEHLPFDAPLTSDIASMAKGVSDWIRRPETPDAFVLDMEEAIREASRIPGRIATLIVPADCVTGEASGSGPAGGREPDESFDAARIDAAVKALRSGEAAALLVSGAAAISPGLEMAGAIADATGAKPMCVPFPARLDRGAGLPQVERLPYFPEMVLERLEGLRYLVLAGAKAPVSFFKYPGWPSDLIPKNCDVVALASEDENPLPYLEALVDAVGAKGKRRDRSPVSRPGKPMGALTTKTVGEAIGATLPEHAIIADESATSGGAAYYLTMQCPPHAALYLTGGGIGMGLPLASGAAVACPERPVLALQGDGGGMYTLQALWTQAREGLNVTNVVFANRKYQILRVEQERAGGDPTGPVSAALTELTRPELDWVALARGMGVPGTRPETAEALTQALERAYAEDGPHLIEVVV